LRVPNASQVIERGKTLARAKAKGIKVGRPKIGIEVRQQIAKRAALRRAFPVAIVQARTAAKRTPDKVLVDGSM
jgi:hypothetical protein